jgi:hypothetical protein
MTSTSIVTPGGGGIGEWTNNPSLLMSRVNPPFCCLPPRSSFHRKITGSRKWNRTDSRCCMVFPIARIDVTSAIGAGDLTRTDHRMRTYWLQEADRLNFKGRSDQQSLTEWSPTNLGRVVHVALGPLVHTSLPRAPADKQLITNGWARSKRESFS